MPLPSFGRLLFPLLTVEVLEAVPVAVAAVALVLAVAPDRFVLCFVLLFS